MYSYFRGDPKLHLNHDWLISHSIVPIFKHLSSGEEKLKIQSYLSISWEKLNLNFRKDRLRKKLNKKPFSQKRKQLDDQKYTRYSQNKVEWVMDQSYKTFSFS